MRAWSLVFLAFLPWVSGCLSFHQGPMPGEPKRATYQTVEGTRVRFLDTGEPGDARPTVVLVHGFASSLETWDLVVPKLRGYRVLALDLKGFGWTDRPEGDYSPLAQAKLVLALMDARRVDRAAVVAHSWGASVALSLTLAAPQRVTRLALYDAWVYEDQIPSMFHWARADGWGEALFATFYKERSEDKIAQAFFDPKFVTQDLVDDVERALDRPGTVAAALAAVRGQRYAEVEPLYRTITQPALLLWGREDKVTFLSFGERLARDLPKAKLAVYPRCGHFPMIEAANASTDDLLAFLGDDAKPSEPKAAVAPAEKPADAAPKEDAK